MNEKKYDLPNGKTVVFYHDENGVGRVTLEAMDALMEMLRCQWIPVSERLPKEETNVLICNANGDIEISSGSYSTELKNEFIWYTSGWRFGKVIAWMPLPEPYKEKDNE